MRQISILNLFNELSNSVKVFFSFKFKVAFNLRSVIWNLNVIDDILYFLCNMNLWGWLWRLLHFIFHTIHCILLMWIHMGFLVRSWCSANAFSRGFVSEVFCFVWVTCIKISCHWSVGWFHSLSHAWIFRCYILFF